MSTHSILVVDDSSTIRNQLRVALEGEGFAVVEAANGELGLEAASTEAVDLIIVDVNMPVMDGLEMVRQVRNLEQHRRTPIFVLTTEFARSMVAQGKAAGVTAWIVKPAKPDLLIKGIRHVLSG